jgi:hypothetical protein
MGPQGLASAGFSVSTQNSRQLPKAMALFFTHNNTAKKISPVKIGLERDIQRLFEKNLEEILNITFLATEYSTSFGGRIDTLGIDHKVNEEIELIGIATVVTARNDLVVHWFG